MHRTRKSSTTAVYIVFHPGSNPMERNSVRRTATPRDPLYQTLLRLGYEPSLILNANRLELPSKSKEARLRKLMQMVFEGQVEAIAITDTLSLGRDTTEVGGFLSVCGHIKVKIITDRHVYLPWLKEDMMSLAIMCICDRTDMRFLKNRTSVNMI